MARAPNIEVVGIPLLRYLEFGDQQQREGLMSGRELRTYPQRIQFSTCKVEHSHKS
jgi:hypothetical protein